MYEKLTDLILNGDYKEALYVFQDEYLHIEEKTPEDASKLCVLEATLWENLCDSEAEFDAISKGLFYDPGNYELFYMLGLYYKHLNRNKAFLCVQMALHYCSDDEDRTVIEAELEELLSDRAVSIRNTSVVILSYNDLDILKDCIEAVEVWLPEGSYEIVVVDNASTQEGVIPFLRSKRDEASYSFKLIENEENLGFSKGCNIGAAACNPGNDIFFLNNDAVLMQNSFLFLKMGLYDKRSVGAVSALSNSASLQEISDEEILGEVGRQDLLKKALKAQASWHRMAGYKSALDIFKIYSRAKVIPKHNPYVKCFRLTGFAILLSKEAANCIAPDNKVFDEYFSPAYFEDDDLGVRLARAGFEQYLCTDSLIYHNGGNGFNEGNELMERSRQKFVEKWGFDIWGYCLARIESAEKILQLAKENNDQLRVIDFTCGFGATAAYIKKRLPTAFVAGVCSTSFEAGIAGLIADDVAFGDMNVMRLPWKSHSFDVVLTDKGLVSRGRIEECLKRGGICIDQEEF